MNMNFNPMMLMQMMKNGNPQQVIMNLLRQNANNPILSNALQLYQNGKYDEIETLARNLCKERNINPDEMLQQIKSQFGK